MLTNERIRALWIGALTVVGTGCSSFSDSAGSSNARDLQVIQGDLQDTVLITGTLQAVRSEVLAAPRTQMWNLSIQHMVEDGSRVQAGEVVLEFDNAELASQLEERKLQALEAQNKLVRERANNAAIEAEKRYAVDSTGFLYEQAKLSADIPIGILSARDYQEKQLLRDRTGITLEKVRDALTAHKKSAALAMEIETIAIETAQRDIAAAESELDALSMKAPRAGIIIVRENPREGRKFKVGDSLWPGLAVLELPDLSEMYVKARLSDVDDGRIEVGMKATIVLDAYPEREFFGQVQDISPVAKSEKPDSLRRVFDVTVSLGQTDAQRMRPGMSVKVMVHARSAQGAVIAPREGLDVAGAKAHLNGGDWKTIEIDWCTPLACVIQSGLKAGVSLEEVSVR